MFKKKFSLLWRVAVSATFLAFCLVCAIIGDDARHWVFLILEAVAMVGGLLCVIVCLILLFPRAIRLIVVAMLLLLLLLLGSAISLSIVSGWWGWLWLAFGVYIALLIFLKPILASLKGFRARLAQAKPIAQQPEISRLAQPEPEPEISWEEGAIQQYEISWERGRRVRYPIPPDVPARPQSQAPQAFEQSQADDMPQAHYPTE